MEHILSSYVGINHRRTTLTSTDASHRILPTHNRWSEGVRGLNSMALQQHLGRVGVFLGADTATRKGYPPQTPKSANPSKHFGKQDRRTGN